MPKVNASRPRVAAALEEGLSALRQDGDLADVLRRHPAERVELMSLLQTSSRLDGFEPPAPDRAARLRGRNRMLALAEHRRMARNRAPLRLVDRFVPRPLLRVGAGLALATALTAGAVTASADSLPGEPLYAIKPAVEQVELALTWDQAANARLRLHFAARRLEEAERLIALGRAKDALALVDAYDAAVVNLGTNRPVPRTRADADDLARFLDADQARADARLQGLASSLAASGDQAGAASVQHAQSHVDQALLAYRRALGASRGQTHGSAAGDPGR